ncbi:hypothetical protein [Mesorhizobium sp. Cs1299R1N3]|uniref:hypothetical protein n=1 Tax=Mesorhizobium sp. Cs1299R1N3 TaxID=3015173 RepID=UPI00301DCFFD
MGKWLDENDPWDFINGCRPVQVDVANIRWGRDEADNGRWALLFDLPGRPGAFLEWLDDDGDLVSKREENVLVTRLGLPLDEADAIRGKLQQWLRNNWVWTYINSDEREMARVAAAEELAARAFHVLTEAYPAFSK